MKSIKKIICAFLSMCMLLSAAALSTGAQTAVPQQLEYGFINSDGVNIEYAIYGSYDSEPLVLLPPNGSDMHSFDGSILPDMAQHYMVITISPRSTGKSDRGTPGELTFDVMSSDLLNVLDYLGIEKTNIFGFSDGGNLGMVFTVQHQERVNKLAIMGANINPFGTKLSSQIGIVASFIFLSIKYLITKDDEIARQRDIEGLMVTQPTLTFKDISQIKVPVLNIYGQSDMIKRTHSKMITHSIEGAKEIMVVGGGHSSCFDYKDTVINPALFEFYGV